MIIGVVLEAQPGETRVAATPTTATQLVELGYHGVVDAVAGTASSFSDEMYVEAGGSIGDCRRADTVLGINPAFNPSARRDALWRNARRHLLAGST
jgi:NAD(P) transhydrogenase subunit alpha